MLDAHLLVYAWAGHSAKECSSPDHALRVASGACKFMFLSPVFNMRKSSSLSLVFQFTFGYHLSVFSFSSPSVRCAAVLTTGLTCLNKIPLCSTSASRKTSHTNTLYL